MRAPSLLDRACYLVFVHLWPLCWDFTRVGRWLMHRAGSYAYHDRDGSKEAL